ncbi:bifunctional demethylmenaquinone methyltransferase/2-methoxy-6-polyprenyl-1,4-benzoquinol methylase UbiE [Robiginitalea sp. SC105]|uniref:bifunctional demethylmenaquinone methyltransferase/2-methoxy-6-polyprenyl-1,4-benzoquinol methylase UbiE n=1 Tax=Robiginitalea sp. SC105 TaxID=2762332 RepID=UPI00163A9BC5|nr:bifunctional demethylmenaquinone methyltransferase/2-methoxy-6-polyprenyl-1,4-benzoquinol methylase UbiE [Robiginitalea sp. SC105]MBC2839021.1 bifunctional demethylmenaquinone methyltransferase/2-methoxy-6-polyprenyl-1,4-benzoquinol methylase UbiE [Robiginitalea sp. SC105]
MAKEILPYDDSGEGKKEQVRTMFNAISEKYDGLNRVISLGIDRRWRKRLVGLVADTRPQSVLDIATGTGDLALALAQTGAGRIVGLDLAPGMLDVGRSKIRESGLEGRIEMVLGDSEALEFPDASFDAVTVAFGVRNFENLEKGLAEIYRVLRPGGILAILETSVPEKQPFRWGYNLYCRFFLPIVGKWLSRDAAAYSYLSRSAAVFPYGERFNNILGKIGFIAMEHRPQTFGAAAIYTATK